jgi:predicted dehydrogenase
MASRTARRLRTFGSGASRRQFLKAGLFAGITIMTAPGVARSYQRNEKLRMASIGAGGQAGAGINAGLGQHLVAVAEVDLENRGRSNIERVRRESPSTKIYTDFRQLFDKHPDLDAVWIGTPDHTHFPAAIRALEAGAGVYCEKPLTWCVAEARKLREVALARKLPTQMGNQGHSSESIRLICEYIWDGALGDVTEVHCISNRRFSASSRPEARPVPSGLDWEAWLGPAPHRPYHDGLHPFNWRGWLDFGTGSLGDMGCHTMDGAVWALKLYEAETFEVEAELGQPTEEGYPPQAVVAYRFPARGNMPPVTLKWFHGGQLPPRPEALEPDEKILTEGTYYYGTKGLMSSGSHCQNTRLIPRALHEATPKPKPVLPRSPHGHGGDFLAACRDPQAVTPSSHFEYSARLTEIVLLGNIACSVGEKITYDLRQGRVVNNDRANALLVRQPRKGWEHGYGV